MTNFLLTKDDTHANFDALSYKGQTYTYLSDLKKETGKQYLSVWVPAAALNYMLDVDGSHDPEIIGKALEELQAEDIRKAARFRGCELLDENIPDIYTPLRFRCSEGHEYKMSVNAMLRGGTGARNASGTPGTMPTNGP